jgi:uncharacterized membrane protein
MKMKSIDKRQVAFYAAVLMAMAAMVYFGSHSAIEYSPYNTEGVSFPSGRVVDVLAERIETNEFGLRLGQQELRVELLSGEYKGDVIDVSNTLYVGQNVYLQAGQRAIVCLDRPSGQGDYYATVQSHDRSLAIYALFGLLLVLLTVVGGKTGASSALGLSFSFVAIVFFAIPLIVQGADPVPLGIGVVLGIVMVSLASTLGFNRKTLVSILGTSIGVAICCALYAAIGAALRVSGYDLPEMDVLTVIGHNTNIRIGGFLFVSVLTASLGAVMDVSVSVASSVWELSEANPSIGARPLFKSGMRVGRDIVGATANTLIMAFIGSSMVALIVYRIYGYQYNLLINSNDVAIEVLQAVASAAALILCSPVTAYIAAQAFGSKPAQHAL